MLYLLLSLPNVTDPPQLLRIATALYIVRTVSTLCICMEGKPKIVMQWKIRKRQAARTAHAHSGIVRK